MTDMIIINQGWLLKSPPEEKMRGRFFKSKWRRRYFVLYVLPSVAGGGLHVVTPSLLMYYEDRELRHKKGAIDLTQCDEVQSLLHNDQHPHLFSIKTRDRNHSRTYFLAADTDDDMHKWVDCLCDVLGMKEEDVTPKFAESSVPPEPLMPLPLPIQRQVTTPPGGVSTPSNTNDYVEPPKPHISPEISSQARHIACTPPTRSVPPVPELPERVDKNKRKPSTPLQPSAVQPPPHRINGGGLEPEPVEDDICERPTNSGSRLSDPSCTSISEQGNEEDDYDIPRAMRNRLADNSYDRPRAISNVTSTPAYSTDRVNSGASEDYYSNAPVQHQPWGSSRNGVNSSSDNDDGDYNVPQSYKLKGAGAAAAASRGVITTELDYTGSVKTAAAVSPAQYKDEADGPSSDDDGVYSAPKSHRVPITADDTYDIPPLRQMVDEPPPAAHGLVHRYVNAASTVVPTSQEVGGAAVSRKNSNMGNSDEVDGIYSSPLSSSRYGQQPDTQMSMTAQSSAVDATPPSVHFTQRSRSFKRGKPNGVADVILPRSIPALAHSSSSSSDSDVADNVPSSPPPAVPRRGVPYRP